MITKWDNRFIVLAQVIAGWSKDPNKQVGAILVSPDMRQWSGGYNGLPRGMDDDMHLTKEKKNALTIHAELNAIFNSVVDITGWTLYISAPPCIQCASAIMQERLERVVFPKLDVNSSWYPSQIEALNQLQRHGIKVDTWQ